MATFKVTKGTPVAFRDSAYPTAYPSPQEGELFYNGSAGSFQFIGVAAGAWSSGGNVNTARKGLSGFGTQTAAIAATGNTPPNTTKVESYNGTTWTEVTNIPSARSFAGYGGTQTAAVSFGGTTPVFAATLEYDGTNWADGGDLGTARYRIGGAGTQTAALGFGGYVGSPPNAGTTATEEYDGSSWTDGGAMGTARNYLMACFGIQTDAMAACGSNPNVNTTEIYNGSSWSAGANYLYGTRGYVVASGPNTNDLRLFGAYTGNIATSNEAVTYNGTAFTTAPFLSTARIYGTSAASAPSGASMLVGGDAPGNSNATEEFTVGSTAETGSTIDFD